MATDKGYLDIIERPGGDFFKVRSTLEELKDVSVSNLSNGQILRYHSGSGWENYTASEMMNTDSTIYCKSYASTTSKEGTSANWSEKIGWYNIILASGNSATNATLSVNEGTAYPIYNNGQNTSISSSATIAAGSHLAYFDGSAFRFTSVGFGATGYTMTSNTLASNRIKIFGSAMPQTTNIGIHPVYNGVLSTYATSNILVRLNGSDNITPKINGQSSSSSGNNTIDVGMHYPYYDGTTWWFRNDGKLTAGGYCIPNGTSSQFLTGDGNYQALYFDGTVADDNQILTESSLAGIIGAMVYKGTVNSNSDLPSSGVQPGWTYVVATAGTYAGEACEVGDMIIAKDSTPTWNVINGENQVTDKNPTLSWGSQSTVATIDGTDIHVTMPAQPVFNTINTEPIISSNNTSIDIKLYDGYVFPNAVQDIDGNWYSAVVIGNQVWMTSNLNTTKYSNGDPLTAHSTFTTETPCYYEYNVTDYRKKYGLLYNWKAVMGSSESSNTNPSGVQGLAPTGWHIPSYNEYDELRKYLNSQSRYPNKRALVTNESDFWTTASNSVGLQLYLNNATNFKVRPAGSFYPNMNIATNADLAWYIRYRAAFWTTTQNDSDTTNAWIMHITYIMNTTIPVLGDYAKTNYYSIRCVSDKSPLEFRAWYVNTYGSMQHHLDGSGSGLDADTLDGHHASYFATASSIPAAANDAKINISNGTVTETLTSTDGSTPRTLKIIGSKGITIGAPTMSNDILTIDISHSHTDINAATDYKGSTTKVAKIQYDAQGHITACEEANIDFPSLTSYVTGPNSATVGNIVTFANDDGKSIQDSGYTIATSVPSGAVFTDTQVTSVDYHYAPSENSRFALTASASGADAAWNIDVVKGITLSRDEKGHVTGVSVTSGKIPANPVSSGFVSSITTTDGPHETITNKSGNVSFIVPTKTSHLTNDSGFLSSHQSIKVDGLTGATTNHYGTSSTLGSTATKDVMVTGGIPTTLEAGIRVIVKFTVDNTSDNPKLNVTGSNSVSTGGKYIYYRGANIAKDALKANRVYEFVYDGTYWQFVGDIDTDTNQTIKVGNSEFSSDDVVEIVGGTNITVAADTESKTITIGNTTAPLTSWSNSDNYAFKTVNIKAQDTTTNTVSGALRDTSLTADSNTATLNLASGNKWIQINGETTKTATFGHYVGTINSSGGNLKKISWDTAGHITAASDASLEDLANVKPDERLFDGDVLVYDSNTRGWTSMTPKDSDTDYVYYCSSSASAADKSATSKSTNAPVAYHYYWVYIGIANSASSALSFKANNSTAYPIYINGTVSSSTNYTLPVGLYFVYYSGSAWYFNTDGTMTISGNQFDGVVQESVTYSELSTLISNDNLIPGKQYRITDYVTTTKTSSTYSSAGHAFDLIVTAIDCDKLDCKASATITSGDTYFSTAGADLEKWQIWYDVNNDTTKYEWADSINGKGVIYRMIDEWGNDCPYDFKNILFTKSNTYTAAYTFNKFASGDTANSDFSLLEGYCYGNVIEPYGYGYTISHILNFIVFLNTSIGTNSGCYSNTFKENCKDNTFNNGCKRNSFGANTQNCNFGNNCTDNNLSAIVVRLGDSCMSNIIKSPVQFGNNCTNNIIGTGGADITFGNYCSYNNIGDYCLYITFGDYCSENTIGNECLSIKFGDSSNTYNYNSNINIEQATSYLRIYNSSSPSSSNNLKNIYITNGCSGTSSSYREISTIPRNRAYLTKVERNTGSNTLRIYTIDEDVVPDITGQGGKVLAVNNDGTGLEWITASSGSGTDENVVQNLIGSSDTNEYPLLAAGIVDPNGTAQEANYSSTAINKDGDIVFNDNYTKCSLQYDSTNLCLNFIFA